MEIAILAAIEAGVEIAGLLDPKSNSERAYGLPVLRAVGELDTSIALVITWISRQPQAAFNSVSAHYGGGKAD